MVVVVALRGEMQKNWNYNSLPLSQPLAPLLIHPFNTMSDKSLRCLVSREVNAPRSPLLAGKRNTHHHHQLVTHVPDGPFATHPAPTNLASNSSKHSLGTPFQTPPRKDKFQASPGPDPRGRKDVRSYCTRA